MATNRKDTAALETVTGAIAFQDICTNGINRLCLIDKHR
jgi:hypothetical protein